jgi:transcriptional regulator with XRE-family HTH domain
VQLSDYLRREGRGSMTRLAEAIGCSQGTLSKIAAGSQWPSRELIQAIERETDGAVTAADIVWLEVRDEAAA